MRNGPSRITVTVLMLLIIGAGVPCQAATPKTTLNIVVRNTYEDLPEPVLQRFSELNPNVQFELIRGTSSTIDEKLTTALAAGLPLDIVISMSIRGWVSYAAQGVFRDLGPYIKADRQELERKGVPAFILDGLKVNGVSAYIPYSIWSSLITIYNATYFDEAGLVRPAARWDDSHWTWSEMIQAARKLVRTTPEGAINRPGFRFDLNDIVMQGVSMAWGGDLFPPETYQTGMIKKVTFDTPTNRRALGHLVDLSVTHRVTNHALPQSGSRSINTGFAAMALIPGGMIDPATYSKDFVWGMAPYPKPDEVANRVAMPSWIRAAAICDRSAHPDMAWKFIKFMLTDAYELGEFESEGRIHSWNLSRGVNPNTWRNYAAAISRSLELAHSQPEMVSFLVQGVGQYTRIAASNALVGGGETIHGTKTPLGMYMLEASQGKIPLEEALGRAEQDAGNVLANIYRNM
jgi:ABC-type glycerol-3-phosphate transport system substrate-binding protein